MSLRKLPKAYGQAAEAMRLSRSMSGGYKNAPTGISFAGGDAVLRRPSDRPPPFKALGDAVAKLNGAYVTADDVGTIVDVRIGRTCKVPHLAAASGRAGGNSPPWRGGDVFERMKTAANRLFSSSLAGRAAAVQGAGSVGVDADADAIVVAEVQIFTPCTPGRALNAETIPGLKTQLVCSVANNQLVAGADGGALRLGGIVYAPDYIVDAGKIVSTAAEHVGEIPTRSRNGRGTSLLACSQRLMPQAKAAAAPARLVTN